MSNGKGFSLKSLINVQNVVTVAKAALDTSALFDKARKNA